MSGLSLITALEIFNHPNDLEIIVGKQEGEKNYAFTLSRGPGHNFKPLISFQSYTEKIDDIYENVHGLLKSIRESCIKELEDKESFLSKMFNHGGGKIDESVTLNEGLIDRIMHELRQKQSASTYMMIKNTV